MSKILVIYSDFEVIGNFSRKTFSLMILGN